MPDYRPQWEREIDQARTNDHNDQYDLSVDPEGDYIDLGDEVTIGR